MKKSVTIVLSLFVIAVVVFSFACARKAAPRSGLQDPSPPTAFTNFGIVEFSEHTPQHFGLGAGNGWNVTAKSLTNGTIEINMLPDDSNTNGTKGINSVTMTTLPSRLVSCQLGTVVVRFTPNLKTQ
jgi:hypothetical protein